MFFMHPFFYAANVVDHATTARIYIYAAFVVVFAANVEDLAAAAAGLRCCCSFCCC
jgi:hypothetical protein